MDLGIQRLHTLSNLELYQFDCTGLVKLPEFLDQRSVETIRSEIFAGPSRVMSGRGDKTRFDDTREFSVGQGQVVPTWGYQQPSTATGTVRCEWHVPF